MHYLGDLSEKMNDDFTRFSFLKLMYENYDYGLINLVIHG